MTMKSSTVTIRVDAKLDRELKRLSRSLKQSKSEIESAGAQPGA
jgi:predicted transcriptional regulator